MSTHNSVLIREAGNGKMEIAANPTLRLAEDMPIPVCLIDMDQAKYMFRARDLSSLLEKGHARMAISPGLWDSPLIPQGVTSSFRDDDIYCVFDVGGNAVGVTMLGQLANLMAGKNTSCYYVINPCYAFSGGMEDILESLSAVLTSTRTLAEGLKSIANPFMGEYTTPELIMEYVRYLETELGKIGLKLHGLAVLERFFGKVRKLTRLPMLELNTLIDKLYI